MRNLFLFLRSVIIHYIYLYIHEPDGSSPLPPSRPASKFAAKVIKRNEDLIISDEELAISNEQLAMSNEQLAMSNYVEISDEKKGEVKNSHFAFSKNDKHTLFK